jgi:hypothetical protein
MSDVSARKKQPRTELKAVESEAKPKRPRKTGARPSTFAGELRELAIKHRSKLGKLTSAEAKLEQKLRVVRAQREAAEGPLRDVEVMLGNHPELPGLEQHNAEVEAQIATAEVHTAADEVNQ